MAAKLEKSVASLFSKKRVTIVVTDSGLGGISILADIAAGLKRNPIFPEVSLVYYNAWPEQHKGYNRLSGTAEQIRAFDAALEGMLRFNPDMIMVACNTLSILYNQTAFSRRSDIPVIDIVDFGVDMVYEHLTGEPDAAALLLGTVTTIASGLHRERLIKKGVSPDRLFLQPCDQLATQIEKGPEGKSVAQLINTFMTQAAEKLDPQRSRLFAALFCTHFGYAAERIHAKLQQLTARPVSLLDPNQRMAAYLFEAADTAQYPDPTINLQVVSRIYWDPVKIDTIAKIIKYRSPEAAQALKKYAQIPDLFTF